MELLSIIIAARNDNYNGNFDKRLYQTLQYNLSHLERIGIKYEVILVEWNPIPRKPLLSTGFSKKVPNSRCYVVKKDIHDQISGPYKHMIFMEFFAKNAGLRRAKGDYILCTNADCFYSQQIFNYLQTVGVCPNTFYKARRCDIDINKVKSLNDPGFEKAVLRRHEDGVIPTNAAGDFTLGSKDLWIDRCTGHDEQQRFVKIHKDGRLFLCASKLGGEPVTFVRVGDMYHIDHESSMASTGVIGYQDSKKTNENLKFGGDGSSYRSANGPSLWNYNDKLPYTNHKHWGLSQEITREVKLHPNVFEIRIKKGKKLFLSSKAVNDFFLEVPSPSKPKPKPSERPILQKGNLHPSLPEIEVVLEIANGVHPLNSQFEIIREGTDEQSLTWWESKRELMGLPRPTAPVVNSPPLSPQDKLSLIDKILDSSSSTPLKDILGFLPGVSSISPSPDDQPNHPEEEPEADTILTDVPEVLAKSQCPPNKDIRKYFFNKKK